ncbi:hypothetical protein NUH88_11345 [Nisaea acidiphila]|uniref:Uncharacterized protein n=1 Tax=Nisaea acidiphila TaxID=1862145 RepID=A0A9J7ARR8_9PROT|nr:hypothetical protein [Nisaea acidiphila]UUX48013.1 hypothetical protein NUH88_11345 [Nisaea acidiphila]
MSLHAYQKSALTADYLRGGLGFAVTAFPVLFAPMLGTFQIIFGLISLVFAGFVVKTWLRGQSQVELAPEGIRTLGPLGKAIAWPDLAEMELRYYSTQKDKAKGWMQLVLKDGNGTKISIESTLDGFDTVLEHAAAAAGRNGVALNQTTTDNLAAAGVSVGLAARDQ